MFLKWYHGYQALAWSLLVGKQNKQNCGYQEMLQNLPFGE